MYLHKMYFCVLVIQSCLTFCDPMDCSPPGSSVCGILQARVLEWVAIPFSRDLPDPGIEPRSVFWLLFGVLLAWLKWNPYDSWFIFLNYIQYLVITGFPGGSDGKESACSIEDLGSIPGSSRSPGEGNGYSLQYFCLENSTDRKAWWSTVHGVTKSQTWLSYIAGRFFTIWTPREACYYKILNIIQENKSWVIGIPF